MFLYLINKNILNKYKFSVKLFKVLSRAENKKCPNSTNSIYLEWWVHKALNNPPKFIGITGNIKYMHKVETDREKKRHEASKKE